MKVAILGRTKSLYDCIDKVKDCGHEIVLIGTCASAPEYEIREKDFEEAARRLGVPFFNDARINSPEIVNQMRNVDADVAISVNWLTIIHQEAVACFKYGILNAHCGDLPKYRGNACPNWAILNGEHEYAISIHYMIPGELDAGDIIIKKFYPITEESTITDIYGTTEKEIPLMFCDALTKIGQGDDQGTPQSKNPNDSLRCYPRIPTDSFVDWNKGRHQILREVRASTHPFQGTFFYWNDMKIYFFDAETKPFPAPCCVYPGQVISVDKQSGTVGIASSDGIVVLKQVYVNGEEYKAADILKSTRIRLNYCVPEEIYTLRRRIDELRTEIKSLRERSGKNA